MGISDDKEIQRLLAEFTAAQALEAMALRQVDTTLESHCKDMDLIHKVTVEMLQAHNKSMDVYFKLLMYKLHPEHSTHH